MNRTVLDAQRIGNFIGIFYYFCLSKAQFIYGFNGIIDVSPFLGFHLGILPHEGYAMGPVAGYCVYEIFLPHNTFLDNIFSYLLTINVYAVKELSE